MQIEGIKDPVYFCKRFHLMNIPCYITYLKLLMTLNYTLNYITIHLFMNNNIHLRGMRTRIETF